MAQNIEHVKAGPKLLETKTIAGIVDQLGILPTRKKAELIFKTQQDFLTHPAVAVDAVEKLTTLTAKPAAKELLEYFHPEKVMEFVADHGKVAKTDDFVAAIEMLGCSGEEVVIAMMRGYVQKPTKTFYSPKSRVRAEEKQRIQQEAARMAEKVGFALAESIDMQEQQIIRQKVMDIIQDDILKPYDEQVALVDLLSANASYAPSAVQAQRAQAIYFTLNMMYHNDMGMSLNQLQKKIKQFSHARVPIGRFLLDIPLLPQKKPPLNKIWNHAGEPHKKPFEEEYNKYTEALQQYADDALVGPTAFLFSFNTALPYPMAARATRRMLRDQGELLKNFLHFKIFLIPAPNNRTIFAMVPPQLITQGKYVDPDIVTEIQKQMRAMVHDAHFEKLDDPVTGDVVDSMVEYLKDAVLPIAPENASQALPVITARAQTGLRAIGSAGVINELKLPSEEFLQEMGLTSLSFNQVDEGIKITAWWGKKPFSYILDFNGNVLGLEALTPENREWFEMVTLLYLSHFRHPSKHQIVDELPISQEAVEFGEKEDGASTETRGPIHSREPYLMVMYHGYDAHQLGSESVNNKVLQRWKMTLDDMNSWLVRIVSDRREITDANSEFNQMLDKHPFGVGLRRHFNDIIQRIMEKSTKPHWVQKTVNGGTVEMLLPTVAKGEIEDNASVWRIAFADEISDGKGEPKHTTCPEAAETLHSIAEATDPAGLDEILRTL